MLNDSDLNHILKEWSFWDQPPPPTITRTLLASVPALVPDLVLVVQGVRRCGKSTLLAQIMMAQRLNSPDCVFVNFEDPRLTSDLDHQLLDRIVSLTRARRPDTARYCYFFDEIQNVSQWQKWLCTRTERPSGDHFVITGSNSTLLSGELASVLTGRHITVELFPFSFTEYLAAKPGRGLSDYLGEGGFPRALSYPDREALLREYYTDIIERDVRRNIAIKSGLPLFRLVKSVFEAMGSEVSQRRLAGMLGVTADTVGVYLNACESAYLIQSCPYFTYSEKQRTARNRKYYPVDLGLRTAVATHTGMDEGKKLEAAVFLELRRKFSQVFYWRGEGEVDFVIQDGTGVTPIQVSVEGIKSRHENALAEFRAQFPRSNPPLIISNNNAGAFLRGGI